MKKMVFYGVVIAAVACMSIVTAGCDSGTDQAAGTATTDTVAPAPRPLPNMLPNLKAVAGDGTSQWQPPPYNATVTFGTYGSDMATCTNSPSLCGASPGVSISQSGDSTAVLGSFVTFSPTIGNLGLCLVVNQGDDSIKLKAALTSYFTAFNPNPNLGQCMPGVYQFASSAIIDPKITQPLGLPKTVLNSSVLCAVSTPSNSYWSIFFYGLYDGAAGNITFAMPGDNCNKSRGLAICNVTNYRLGMVNTNAVYFSTYYDSEDSSTMSVNLMFNMDTVINQNAGMKQYFNFDGPGQPQLVLSQDFTFGSDRSLQKSTGIPGGTVIPAGSYAINQNYSVSYPDNTLQFTGWVSVLVPKVKVIQPAASDSKMKKKK